MKKNTSFSLVVLSLMGIGITFQMAENTMNKDLDWMMEARLLDYVNPVAVSLCLIALGISLGFLIQNKIKDRIKQQQD